jgi:hypothetical protein
MGVGHGIKKTEYHQNIIIARRSRLKKKKEGSNAASKYSAAGRWLSLAFILFSIVSFFLSKDQVSSFSLFLLP